MKAAFAEGHPEPAGALSVAALELCKDMIAGKNDVARIRDIQRRAQI